MRQKPFIPCLFSLSCQEHECNDWRYSGHFVSMRIQTTKGRLFKQDRTSFAFNVVMEHHSAFLLEIQCAAWDGDFNKRNFKNVALLVLISMLFIVYRKYIKFVNIYPCKSVNLAYLMPNLPAWLLEPCYKTALVLNPPNRLLVELLQGGKHFKSRSRKVHLELQPLIEVLCSVCTITSYKILLQLSVWGSICLRQKEWWQKAQKNWEEDHMVSIIGNFRWLTSNSSLQ